MNFINTREPTIQADPNIGIPPSTLTMPQAPVMPGASSLGDAVRESIAIGKENNRLLRRIIFFGRVSFWTKLVFWALVLGLPVLFFQPIVQYVSKQVSQNPAAFGLPSSAQIQKAINDFKLKQQGAP